MALGHGIGGTMADIDLAMIGVMLQRLLDDVRLLKDGQQRIERHIARSERRDADNLAAHADHLQAVTDLRERIDRIERRLDLSGSPSP